MELAALVRRNGSRSLFDTLNRFPDRMFTINELAKTANTPFATAWRIVNEWEKVGVIDVFSIGKSRAVRLGEGAIIQSLSELFALESPHALALKPLRGLLAKDANIKAAYLFGSAASGKEGIDSDLDVALLAAKAYSPTGLSLNFHQQSRLKLVPLVFSSKQELEKFMEGKESVKLK